MPSECDSMITDLAFRGISSRQTARGLLLVITPPSTVSQFTVLVLAYSYTTSWPNSIRSGANTVEVHICCVSGQQVVAESHR
jgi:hypothetical protein